MVKENIVILLDNSEYTRNGDYTPTRFQAEQLTANLIIRAKLNSNLESKVGILTMAGRSPVVVTSLTSESSKLISQTGQVEIDGFIQFSKSVKIASLAVKCNSVMGGSKRLIIFVASPIKESKKELITVAKRLRKNNISVDVIDFGENEGNTEKLQEFVNQVKKKDNCTLKTVKRGPHILSDVILTSRILENNQPNATPNMPQNTGTGNTGGGAPASGNDRFKETGGIDPNLDPELAEAMRLSIQEERQRREASQKKDEDKNEKPTEQTGQAEEEENEDDEIDYDDDEMMRRAIEMSMINDGKGEQDKMDTSEEKEENEDPEEVVDDEELMRALQMSREESGEDDVDDDELQRAINMSKSGEQDKMDTGDDEDIDDDELQRAINMSKMEGEQDKMDVEKENKEKKEKEEKENIKDILGDDDFLNDVLSSLGKKEDTKDKKEKK